MANNINEAIESIYEARDCAAKEYVVNDLSEFLSNWADAVLHQTPLGDIETDIPNQMPILLAEFVGWMMVGLCNSKDGPMPATIQARFLDMFESGMCEAPVLLRLDTRMPVAEPAPVEFNTGHSSAIRILRNVVKHSAPSTGPDWFVDLMGSIEIALDEAIAEHPTIV